MDRSPDGYWHAYKDCLRTGTLTTGSATAFGGALAPCDGSDLLPLRLLSTCSLGDAFFAPPQAWKAGGLLPIPRRSTPRRVPCAPSQLRQPSLAEGATPPEHVVAY